VGAAKGQTVRDLIAFGDHVLDGDGEIRKGGAVERDQLRDALGTGWYGGGLFGSWLTASGAKSFSHRVALPVLRWSSQKWRTSALFASVDIIVVEYLSFHAYSRYPVFQRTV